MSLLEHPVGLADAGRHAQVDAEPPPTTAPFVPDARQHLVGRRPDIEQVALGSFTAAARPGLG